jgi:hypothetical protein
VLTHVSSSQVRYNKLEKIPVYFTDDVMMLLYKTDLVLRTTLLDAFEDVKELHCDYVSKQEYTEWWEQIRDNGDGYLIETLGGRKYSAILRIMLIDEKMKGSILEVLSPGVEGNAQCQNRPPDVHRETGVEIHWYTANHILIFTACVILAAIEVCCIEALINRETAGDYDEGVAREMYSVHLDRQLQTLTPPTPTLENGAANAYLFQPSP